jgi:hypothetical protein
VDKNNLTPAQIARRKYEEKNREERKQASAQFSTFIPREMYNDINAFLEKHKISKVQLIFEGFEALRKQYEPRDKK